MRRAWKWFKRITAFVLALALLAVAAFLIIIHTDWGREQIRKQVESALRGQFPGGVHIGHLDGSVFTTLELTDIELDGADGKPLIKASKLRLRPKLLPLLWKTVRVENVSAFDVAIDWRDQPAKPPKPPSNEPSSPSAWSIELQRIVVHRGHLSVAGQPYTIDNLELGGSFAIPAGRGIELTTSLHALWKERNAPIAATVAFSLVDGEPTVSNSSITVGGVSITAADIHDEQGTVFVRGSADAIRALVPTADLPGDVLLEVSADEHHLVTITGALGSTPLEGSVQYTKTPFSARGTIGTHDVDLGALTKEKLHGLASAVVSFATDGKQIHATVVGIPRIADIPVDTIVVNASGTKAGGHAIAFIEGPGGLHVVGAADVTPTKVTSSHVAVALDDPSFFLPKARGKLRANLTASGPFATLAFTGTANGRGVGFDAFGAGEALVDFSGRVAKPRPYGIAHVVLRGIQNGRTPLGSAVIDAKDDTSGRIALKLHAEPNPSVQVDLDASARQRGSDWLVDLGNHRVNTPTALLSGQGGHVDALADRVVLRDFRTSAGQGGIDLAATFTKATGGLVATATLQQVELDELVPQAMGHLDGTLELTKRGSWWTARGDLTGTGMHGMDTIAADATLKLALDGRKLDVQAKATNPQLGGADVLVEMIGPQNPFDVVGWMELPRNDVTRVEVTLHDLKPNAVSAAASGNIAGSIVLTATDAKGQIDVTGVTLPMGEVTVNATVVPAPDGDIGMAAQAKLTDVGAFDLSGRLQLPDRPLSPAAWKALGRHALRSLSAEVEKMDVTPAMLAKFGIDAPYRGQAHVQVAVGPGGETSKLQLDIVGLVGGALFKPVDVHGEASTSEDGSSASIHVDAPHELVRLDAKVPVTTDQWLAGGWAGNKTAALSGTLQIPPSPAVELLAIVGRTHLTRGDIDGRVDIAGTLAVPTAKLAIHASDIAVAASAGDKAPPVLKDMTITGDWDGTTGNFLVDGFEATGGKLHVDGKVAPSNLAAGSARMNIGKIDLVPIAAFLPGAYVSLAGQLDAAVTVTGFSTDSLKLGGSLALTHARIPVSPTVGTLQNANVRIDLFGRDVEVQVDADLGVNHDPTPNLHAEAKGDLSKLDIKAKLHQVQPSNALRPLIDADVDASLQHTDRWTGTVNIRNGHIFVPQKKGSNLMSSSTPDDLVFVDKPTPIAKTFIRPPPEHPNIDVAVDLRSTLVEVEDIARANVSGNLQLKLGGGGIGLDGSIDARGSTYLFDRQYDIDHGSVTFDGTMDGLINVRIVHDFPDLSLVAEVGGRVSDPQIELSSVPAQYTQGQLLGFLLGGEPGGDPTAATQDVAVGAGSSIASTILGSKVKQVVKVIDVLRCDAATSAASASCTVGKWITQKLFASYKPHYDARPDENRNEFEFQYYLRRSIVLDLVGGDTNHDSFDVLWRKRW